eukprot:3278307-Rhodomonas_salina.2
MSSSSGIITEPARRQVERRPLTRQRTYGLVHSHLLERLPHFCTGVVIVGHPKGRALSLPSSLKLPKGSRLERMVLSRPQPKELHPGQVAAGCQLRTYHSENARNDTSDRSRRSLRCRHRQLTPCLTPPSATAQLQSFNNTHFGREQSLPDTSCAIRNRHTATEDLPGSSNP